MKKYFKKEWPILSILVLAIFLRFYRFESLTTFLGEQGRDLLIARQIVTGEKLTLLGPPTSLSPNVNFGPLYHYFNAFWLWLFRFYPVGPAFGFGVLSVLACFCLYLIGKNFGYKRGGLFSALIFAVSPLMVEMGRSMFNSYLIVFFSVFSFWALSKFWLSKKNSWLTLSGLFSGVAVQANFLAWGMIVSRVSFLLIFTRKKITNHLSYLSGVFLGVLPYLTFELRHNFFNFRGLLSLIGGESFAGFSQEGLMTKIIEVIYKPFFFALGNQNTILTIFVISFLTLISIKFYSLFKKEIFLKIVFLFWLINLLAVRLYPGQLLGHYVGSIYLFLFLYLGYLWEFFLKKKRSFVGLFLLVIIIFLNLVAVNLNQKQGPGMFPGWTVREIVKTGRIIAADAESDFNVAAILDGDTRAYPYRYVIDVLGKKPLGVEEYPKTRTLYLVSHLDSQATLHYPVWEITCFLPAKITKTWPINDKVSLYKLQKI